jgi:hypothetical protein
MNNELFKILEFDPDLNKNCVGCGYCCIRAMCRIGLEKYGLHDICPGLFWDGKKYRCRLVRSNYKNIILILAIGKGCCSNLNTWRKNVRERDNKEIEKILQKSWVNIKDLVYDFFDLAYITRVGILKDLELINEEELDIEHTKIIEKIVKRAKDRGKLIELREKIKENGWRSK